MIPVSEAIGIVREKTALLEVERVKLADALGRVLAEDVLADTDLPPFDRAQIAVSRRPGVAVLATGTELVRVEERPGEDQIRDSNTYSLAAYAQLAGARVERLPFAGDDAELLRREIEEAASRSDVLVLSGGVSMGRYDFTKDALRALDAEVFFERVSLRPGKPTVFARLHGDRPTLVFGLPGNPVSVSVTFNLFARAAIRAMQGALSP